MHHDREPDSAQGIHVGGRIRRRRPLGLDELLDLATIDRRGVVAVEMVDVLALLRPEVTTELILADLVSGARCALPIRRIADGSDVSIVLVVRSSPDGGSGAEVTAHLRCPAADRCPGDRRIRSLQAVTFREFVGVS